MKHGVKPETRREKLRSQDKWRRREKNKLERSRKGYRIASNLRSRENGSRTPFRKPARTYSFSFPGVLPFSFLSLRPDALSILYAPPSSTLNHEDLRLDYGHGCLRHRRPSRYKLRDRDWMWGCPVLHRVVRCASHYRDRSKRSDPGLRLK